MFEHISIIATPPGASLQEALLYRGIKKKYFAKQMKMTKQQFKDLINGDIELTHEIATKLEELIGIPSHFWIKLEKIYREKLSQIQNDINN